MGFFIKLSLFSIPSLYQTNKIINLHPLDSHPFFSLAVIIHLSIKLGKK